MAQTCVTGDYQEGVSTIGNPIAGKEERTS